jgi:hypothetical protein
MSLEPSLWFEIKQLLVHASGWPRDTLHVIGGVILQLAVALCLRRTIADWRPWTTVLLLQLLNEAYDLWLERWPSAALQLGEGLRDIVATMLLPTLLLVAARWCPRLFAHPR